jgi:hypothetical protein
MWHDHANLNPKMRAILLDWLRSITVKLRMDKRVAPLAEDIIDIIVDVDVPRAEITTETLQMWGCAAHIFAVVTVESDAVCLESYVAMCDRSFKVDDLLAARDHVARVLHMRPQTLRYILWHGR